MNETVSTTVVTLDVSLEDSVFISIMAEGKKGTWNFRPLIVEQPYSIYLCSCPSSEGLLPLLCGVSVHHDIRLPCPGSMHTPKGHVVHVELTRVFVRVDQGSVFLLGCE